MSYAGWQGLYREAVLETNFEKMLERIEAAEKAIARRSLFGKELTVGECLALETSLYQLRALRQERTELRRSRTSKQSSRKLREPAKGQPVP